MKPGLLNGAIDHWGHFVYYRKICLGPWDGKSGDVPAQLLAYLLAHQSAQGQAWHMRLLACPVLSLTAPVVSLTFRQLELLAQGDTATDLITFAQSGKGPVHMRTDF